MNAFHGTFSSWVKKLGNPASGGCIRNKNENAKWLYNNKNIKMESNTNKIGVKYVKSSVSSSIPITFISGKEYDNLIESLESKELWIQVTSGNTEIYFKNIYI